MLSAKSKTYELTAASIALSWLIIPETATSKTAIEGTIKAHNKKAKKFILGLTKKFFIFFIINLLLIILRVLQRHISKQAITLLFYSLSLICHKSRPSESEQFSHL